MSHNRFTVAVDDEIFDPKSVASMDSFKKFLQERIKVQGKTGNLKDDSKWASFALSVTTLGSLSSICSHRERGQIWQEHRSCL